MNQDENSGNILDVIAADRLRDFKEKFIERIPVAEKRAATIEPNTPGSEEYFKRVGEYWSQARDDEGLTMREVADIMGVSGYEVRFLEAGMGTLEQITDTDFLTKYASALGKHDLYDGYRQQFKPEQITK